MRIGVFDGSDQCFRFLEEAYGIFSFLKDSNQECKDEDLFIEFRISASSYVENLLLEKNPFYYKVNHLLEEKKRKSSNESIENKK